MELDPGENPNPDGLPPVGGGDSAIETLGRVFQENLALGKRYRFWETQPVAQFNEVLLGNSSLPEGPIDPPTPPSEVQQEPYPLPGLYEWDTCDMGDEETCDEVYDLLARNYIEEDDSTVRLNFSKEFLLLTLRPPGYHRAWHVGIRAKATKKLMGFISGVPTKIRVRGDVIRMAEINFLCLQKRLRAKRLAPLMIKEMTRRVKLENTWQAVYASAVILPTPITTRRFWNRPLNPKKLIDIGDLRLGGGLTADETIRHYQLPESTATPGFRSMEPRDVPAVAGLLRDYLAQFVVAPDFDENDVAHRFLPAEDAVESYVVESPETHQVTDFCSYCTVPWLILGNHNYSTLKEAFLTYVVSTRTPLPQLMNDVLIVARLTDHDLFDALDVMHNDSFLTETRFIRGHREFHFYLYNYRFRNPLRGSEFGLVLM